MSIFTAAAKQLRKVGRSGMSMGCEERKEGDETKEEEERNA